MRVIFLIMALCACLINANLFYNKIIYKNIIKVDKKCKKIKLKTYQAKYFFTNEFSLISFFKNLKNKKCFRSIKLECKMKNFDYSSSTKLIYQHFCKTINLKKKCLSKLSVLLGLNQTELKNSSWQSITKSSFETLIKKPNSKPSNEKCIAFIILANLGKVKNLEFKEYKSLSMCGSWQLEIIFNKKKLYNNSNLDKLVNFCDRVTFLILSFF